jgi:pimeloyl-ACP methyl ester carboxylesterase
VLVHGAANSAAVWIFWQEELCRRGWSSHALDLRGHGLSAATDLSTTRMQDYASDVIDCAAQLRHPPVLIGWSMGGLVALMAAAAIVTSAWVGLGPSAPARHRRDGALLRTGEFGPEEYGIVDRDPARQPSMPDLDLEERIIALASLGRESRLARDERSAGIAIEPPAAPCLVATGGADESWPRHRYQDVPLAADFIAIEAVSHWGLVLNRRALPGLVSAVSDWLNRMVQKT